LRATVRSDVMQVLVQAYSSRPRKTECRFHTCVWIFYANVLPNVIFPASPFRVNNRGFRGHSGFFVALVFGHRRDAPDTELGS